MEATSSRMYARINALANEFVDLYHDAPATGASAPHDVQRWISRVEDVVGRVGPTYEEYDGLVETNDHHARNALNALRRVTGNDFGDPGIDARRNDLVWAIDHMRASLRPLRSVGERMVRTDRDGAPGYLELHHGELPLGDQRKVWSVEFESPLPGRQFFHRQTTRLDVVDHGADGPRSLELREGVTIPRIMEWGEERTGHSFALAAPDTDTWRAAEALYRTLTDHAHLVPAGESAGRRATTIHVSEVPMNGIDYTAHVRGAAADVLAPLRASADELAARVRTHPSMTVTQFVD